MPLDPGTRVGPYEIVALLGAGGMGEVYRARDSRLGRDVAIKALPASLAHDSDRLARFEREARLLASLSHPNIAAIYGLEEASGQRFLVLEHVEGETLARRLAQGALPIDEALEVCRDIAAGVEAAHEGGVVHRDLKPGNVMLTPAGAVKVLDFGLAKSGATTADSSNPGLSASPTMTYAATQAGMVLGTAAYMSPEQARGKSVDRRTDIWSFGCVLHECLCGRPAFEGETISDLVARILEREPDWSALPARTPARLRELLKRCLIKDPKQRLRDIGDARLELEQLVALGSSTAIAAADAVAGAGARARANGLPWLGVGGVALVAVAATAFIQPMLRPREQTIARRFEIAAPEPFRLRTNPVEYAISPDGRMVAMVLVDSTDTGSLWVRPVDSFKPRPLPGTNGAMQPFWSPDSRSLGFFAAEKLKTIAIAGGDPEVLCGVRAARGGTWNRNGVILFAPTSNGPLYTVPAAGGDPVVASRVDSIGHETAHRFPRFLPDGRHYLFSVLGGGARVTTAVGTLGDTAHRAAFEGASAAVWAPSGHLLFLRKGVLSAQRFDVGSRRLSGEPVSLGETPPLPQTTGGPVVSVANDGTLAYFSAPLPMNRIEWLDERGQAAQQVPVTPGSYAGIALSPDDRSALVNHAVSQTDFALLLVDLERGTTNRVSPEGHVVEGFAWSPDGRHIAYLDGGGNTQAIVVVPADGSGPGETVLPAGADFRRIHGWTPDGKALVIGRLDPETQWDLWILPLEGDRQPRPYLRRPADENGGEVSPDGRWLAYNSNESGRMEGYVQSFPTPGRRYQVTTDGTGIIAWKHDGKQLALGARPDGIVRVVDVLPGEEFRVGPPRATRKLPEVIFGAAVNRDWTRVIAIMPAGKQPAPTVRIVLDWTAMLARR